MASAERQEDLRGLVRSINDHLEKHALTGNDLRSLLTQADSARRRGLSSKAPTLARILAAAESVTRSQEVPSDTAAFKALTQELSEILEMPYPRDVFDTRVNVFGREVRRLFSSLLVGFTAYVVLGGILTGHSAMVAESPLMGLTMLAFLILLLGAYEGLQISVTTLRLKDLASFKEKYPRAYSLHRLFRSEEGTRRFLAGRQLFVIVIVFFAARLASFPDLSVWPGTAVSFPAWMTPWFQLIFLKLGVLGALLVLWIGQLAPQFLANKHPHGFLNIRGMGIALQTALFVETLGFTRPGEWLALWAKGEEDIPISPRESFRQALYELEGYATIGVKKIWALSASETILRCRSSTMFVKHGFDRIVIDSLEIKGMNPKPSFFSQLLSLNDGDERQIYQERVEEERLADSWVRLKQGLYPNWGPFLPGDVLLTETTVRFDNASADSIRVTRPTKYIAFRLEFTDTPRRIGSAIVRIYKMDEAVANYDPIHEEELGLQYDRERRPFFEFILSYPQSNTYYQMQWDVEF